MPAMAKSSTDASSQATLKERENFLETRGSVAATRARVDLPYPPGPQRITTLGCGRLFLIAVTIWVISSGRATKRSSSGHAASLVSPSRRTDLRRCRRASTPTPMVAAAMMTARETVHGQAREAMILTRTSMQRATIPHPIARATRPRSLKTPLYLSRFNSEANLGDRATKPATFGVRPPEVRMARWRYLSRIGGADCQYGHHKPARPEEQASVDQQARTAADLRMATRAAVACARSRTAGLLGRTHDAEPTCRCAVEVNSGAIAPVLMECF